MRADKIFVVKHGAMLGDMQPPNGCGVQAQHRESGNVAQSRSDEHHLAIPSMMGLVPLYGLPNG